MEEQRRPEVVLVRSSLPVRSALPPLAAAAPRRPWVLIAATALALLVAGAAPTPAAPVPVTVMSAMLVAEPTGLAVSQSGVLVLPLELRNPGLPLEVTAASAYAEPVVDDVVVQAPRDVGAQDLRRFVALIAPDCRLLRQGSPIEFRATVQLQVRSGSARKDLVLDVAAVPGVRASVGGLCG